MMRQDALRDDERGMTLVELLVVIVILGVVGGVAFAGVLSALQSSRHTNERIDATQELEIALQRIVRDVRGTSQQLVIEAPPPEVDVTGYDERDAEYYGFHIVTEVPEGLDENDQLESSAISYFLNFGNDGDEPARLIRELPTGEQILVTLVDVDVTEPIFRFRDIRGNPIECVSTDCANDLVDAAQLEIVLTRNLRGRDSIVTARTQVFIRNIRYDE